MKSRNKMILGALAAAAIILLAYGGYYFWHIAHVGVAYKAKILGSRFEMKTLEHKILALYAAPTWAICLK